GVDTALRPGGHAGPRPREVRARPRDDLVRRRRRHAPGTAHRARPAPCRAAARDDTDPGPGDHHLGPHHRTPRKRLGEGQDGDGQKRPCLRRPLRGTGGTAPDASRPRGQRALPGPLPPAPRRRGYRPVDRVHLSRPGGRTVVPPSETLTRIGEVVEVGLESTPARKNWRKLMQDVVTHFPGHATLFEEKYLEGKAEGEARGEARGILRVLEVRGIAVSDEVRRRITDCTDLDVLGDWLDRSGTVERAEDLFDGREPAG